MALEIQLAGGAYLKLSKGGSDVTTGLSPQGASPTSLQNCPVGTDIADNPQNVTNGVAVVVQKVGGSVVRLCVVKVVCMRMWAARLASRCMLEAGRQPIDHRDMPAGLPACLLGLHCPLFPLYSVRQSRPRQPNVPTAPPLTPNRRHAPLASPARAAA